MIISYDKNNVCSRKYNNFTVLYDLKNKQILTLESVSEDIWAYIHSGQKIGFESIVEHISEIYECDISQISEDIEDFLTELYLSEIIQIDGNYYISNDSASIDSSPIEEPDDFEGKIIELLAAENQLYSVTFEMTYTCNEKCIHCYANYPTSSDNSVRISVDKYKEIIDELYQMNCMHIAFTGGDPFMNTDFIDIFEYARSKEFVCDIFTNAQYIAEHTTEIEDIIHLNPRAFYISLYGSSPQIHDHVTTIPGSFNKTVNAIKFLRRKEVSVVLNVMILSVNYFDLENIISLAKELDVEYRVSMSIIKKNDGSDSPMSYFVNDKEKLKNLLTIIDKNLYTIDKPMDYSSKNEYLCGAGVTSLCISPDGSIYPCVSLKSSFGNIASSTIQKAWDSPQRKNILESLKWENTTECASCKYQQECPHCAGISQSETGDMFSCNTCDKIIAQCIHENRQ